MVWQVIVVIYAVLSFCYLGFLIWYFADDRFRSRKAGEKAMTDDSEERDEARRERDIAVVKNHCAQLAEHFDTVQIFVSKHNPSESGGTTVVQWGSGSWYARYGQIREWLIKEEEEFRQNVRTEE